MDASHAALLQRIAIQPMRYVAGWIVRTVPDYCRSHSHAPYEIVYHRRGRGVTTVAPSGDRLEFAPDSVIIYPPGMPHDQEIRSAGEDVCVLVEPADPRGEVLTAAQHIPGVVDLYLVREMVSLANVPSLPGELRRLALDRRAGALWTALMDLMLNRTVAVAKAGDHAHRARRYIELNCRTITRIADVAAALGISEDHLRHSYKACHGTTPQADLTRARIEHAANLVLHSTLPLKTVAALSGFTSEQYLCTCFRRIMGCTPGEFRRKAEADRL